MPSVEELLVRTYPPPDFLVEPFVARGGITLLYGKSGTGKSPLTWEIARCVSTGIRCLGLSCKRGKVLYLDRETDEGLVMPRIQQMPRPSGGWHIEFLNKDPINMAFQFIGDWDLVIWNSLRKFLSTQSLNSGELVSPFYDTLKSKWPNAAHLVIHHERKSPNEDDVAPKREMFSGSMAWLDQCQIGVQLVSTPGYYSVRHIKSQVSGLMERDLKFSLSEHGGVVEPYEPVRSVAELVEEAPGDTIRDKVEWVAKKTGKSVVAVWQAFQGHTQK